MRVRFLLRKLVVLRPEEQDIERAHAVERIHMAPQPLECAEHGNAGIGREELGQQEHARPGRSVGAG